MKKVAISITLLLVVSGLWSLLQGDKKYPITNEHPTSGSNIIAFGDSLTQGVGALPKQSWPSQLSKRLGVPIINAGVKGDTTDDALKRLQAEVLGKDPKMVIVLLGGNDYLQKRNRAQTFQNLQAIITKIQGQGALVILVGADFPLAGSFARLYRETAQKLGCPYIPNILKGILGHGDLTADSIHPNAAGYKLMADRIEPVVRQYLNRPSPASPTP